MSYGSSGEETSRFKVAHRMDPVTDESKASSGVLSSSLTSVKETNCEKLDVQKIVCESKRALGLI